MFKTTRLQLSPLTVADAAFLVELLNSPDWLKYIGDRGIHSEADAINYLEKKVFPGYANGGLAGWRVALRTNNTPIGNCGFYQRDFLEHPDLGFAFLPAYVGQGYGYEAAKGCMEYGKSVLGLSKVSAFTVKYNAPSIGLLKKLGFVEKGPFFMPNDSEELLLFETEL